MKQLHLSPAPIKCSACGDDEYGPWVPIGNAADPALYLCERCDDADVAHGQIGASAGLHGAEGG